MMALADRHECDACCIRNRSSRSRPAPAQIFNTFGALFASKGEIGVQQLGGAVMIIRVYSNLFQDEDGWRRVLWFSVILNVNLALAQPAAAAGAGRRAHHAFAD